MRTATILIKTMAFWAALNLFLSCEDFVAPGVPTSDLTSETVFSDDATAEAAIKGIYHQMLSGASGFAGGGRESVTALGGISADLLIEYARGANRSGFYENSILPENTINLGFWSSFYQTIYRANVVLEGLSAGNGVSENMKRQLEGEARFVRAFAYFYLAGFYGDVPWTATTDYRQNAIASRTPEPEIYDRVVKDLELARDLLPGDYQTVDGERTRPNRFAASAMLARVALYREDWAQAESYATEVIESGVYKLLPELNNVFLAHSREAIWQLLPVSPNYNTWEGYYFILENDPSFPLVPSSMALSKAFVQSFSPDDLRKENWIGRLDTEDTSYAYPYKYKVKSGTTLTEYSMVLRLSEQYLVRAEARVRQGNMSGALEDLNTIRRRAGLEDTPAFSPAEIQQAILEERKKELFTEWGHRWLDLKRTGEADHVLGSVKPHWRFTAKYFPIPEQEILNNPNLTQNQGY